MSGTILLAEDDAELRHILSEVLKSLGYVVVPASGRAELFAALAASTFDAVVTDVRMPGVNGVSFVEALRAQHDEVPVVVMSGESDPEVVARIAKVPRCVFLPKPFEPAALGAALARVTKG